MAYCSLIQIVWTLLQCFHLIVVSIFFLDCWWWRKTVHFICCLIFTHIRYNCALYIIALFKCTKTLWNYHWLFSFNLCYVCVCVFFLSYDDLGSSQYWLFRRLFIAAGHVYHMKPCILNWSEIMVAMVRCQNVEFSIKGVSQRNLIVIFVCVWHLALAHIHTHTHNRRHLYNWCSC